MKEEYNGKNCILKVLNTDYCPQVLRFYEENRDFFPRWEVEWPGNFLSEEYQYTLLDREYLMFKNGVFVRFYIFTPEDKEFKNIIGTVSLNRIRGGYYQSGELGYKIHKDYLRRGYAKDGILSCLSFAFNEMSLHRICCYISSKNHPSLSLIKRLPFQIEGICRSYVLLHGEWEDHYLFSCLNDGSILRYQ